MASYFYKINTHLAISSFSPSPSISGSYFTMAPLVSIPDHKRSEKRKMRTVFRWTDVYGPRTCSYCGRQFRNLYAWGGHMTAHRRQIVNMREEHQASLMSQELAVSTGADRELPTDEGRVCVATAEPPRTLDFLGLGKLIDGGGPAVVAAAHWEALEDGLDLSLKL